MRKEKQFNFLLIVLIFFISSCGARYYQRIIPKEEIDFIGVSIEDAGGVFWEAKIRNTGKKMTKLIWDESVYISTKGKSSRLIRGRTRKIHSSQVQPASPIPPNGGISELFTSEDLVEYASRTNIGVGNPNESAYLYLTFSVDNEKLIWSGKIKYEKIE